MNLHLLCKILEKRSRCMDISPSVFLVVIGKIFGTMRFSSTVKNEECKELSNEHEIDNLIISATSKTADDSSEMVSKKGKAANNSYNDSNNNSSSSSNSVGTPHSLLTKNVEAYKLPHVLFQCLRFRTCNIKYKKLYFRQLTTIYGPIIIITHTIRDSNYCHNTHHTWV